MSTTSECPGDGQLRAYLDGQLGEPERLAVEEHLAACPACERSKQEMAARMGSVSHLMAQATPAAADAEQAWCRFQGRVAGPRPNSLAWRFQTMWHTLHTRLRVPALSAASIAVVASLILVPPLRTAAAQLLDVFRVQQLKVISFDPAKAPSLASFTDTLFSRAEVDEVEPQPVASAEEAAQLAGYAVRLPAYVPDGLTLEQLAVMPQRHANATVNVPAVRTLLEAAGLSTDALPTDPDDASISAIIPPLTRAHYSGIGTDVTNLLVFQTTSPQVSIPAGMDLTRLGSLGLQLLGLWPEEADRVSAGIDWANTLVIPIPSDASTAREISVHGYPGYLLQSEDDDEPETFALWQEGDMLYSVSANLKASEVLRVAESLR
ncbi:MAG: zf-HC2 domain-containing protein [Anaerolineae bacterium]